MQSTEYNAKGMTGGVGGIQAQTKGPSSNQGGAARLRSHLNDQCESVGGRRWGEKYFRHFQRTRNLSSPLTFAT